MTGREKLLMYSCTKPLTAVTTLRLIDDGALSLDTLVEDILPEYKEVYLLDELGNKRAPKNKITIRHLLTMTAGLVYARQNYPIEEALRNKPHGISDTRAVVNSLVKSALVFEPGEKFNYSFCHDVLGAVIEEVSGMPFSKYMEKVIFKPLGMNETYFSAPYNPEVCDQYIATESGVIKQIDKHNSLIFSSGYESGGASLISTVTDFAKFGASLSLGAITPNGERIIKESTLKLLYTPVFDTLSVDNNYTCVQGDDYSYGLGVRTRTKATEWGLSVGEFGWDGAAGSYLMVDPVKKCTVVIGANVLSWPIVLKGKHLEIVKRIYEKFGL